MIKVIMKLFLSASLLYSLSMGAAENGTFAIGRLNYTIERPNTTVCSVTVSAVEDSIHLASHSVDSVIHIPGKVIYDGKEYIVRAVTKNGFTGCSFIRNLIIEEGVKVIEDKAFELCSNMESVALPISVDSIGLSPFAGCERLKQIKVDSRNPSYDSRQDCNAIIDSKHDVLCAACPATVIPPDITGIGMNAFSACSGIQELSIPEGVKYIGSKAFSYCNDLQSVRLPSTLEQMGQDVFYDCRHLERISVDEGNTTYDSRDNCNAIIEDGTKLLVGCSRSVIPQGVEYIANDAFLSCHGMNSIIIPEGVKAIGNGAFRDCTALKSIPLPHSLEIIGDYVFSGCTSLDSVYIPEHVESIGASIFSGCTSLKTIRVDEDNRLYDSRQRCNAIVETKGDRLIAACMNTAIVDGIKCIESHAFSSIPVANINIPASTERICPEAFTGLKSCLSINVDQRNRVFDSRQGCNAIVETSTGTLLVGCRNTMIPKGVKRIGPYAFYNGTLYWSLLIPEGVETIGESSFSHCDGLEFVSFPRSLTQIEDFAFFGCHRLRDIVIKGDARSIELGWRVFNETRCSANNILRSGMEEKVVHKPWE